MKDNCIKCCRTFCDCTDVEKEKAKAALQNLDLDTLLASWFSSSKEIEEPNCRLITSIGDAYYSISKARAKVLKQENPFFL